MLPAKSTASHIAHNMPGKAKEKYKTILGGSKRKHATLEKMTKTATTARMFQRRCTFTPPEFLARPDASKGKVGIASITKTMAISITGKKSIQHFCLSDAPSVRALEL
ncbi:hypothetical protein [Desulfovirgula thermocuniculi]|uniref:hypothetical protein n=1 Tax=Desulfovirgula thermocuniculi TaxID=348842 RepID=UPI0012EB178B|nr:hypothetical protein [Desulfovirgula thermocuniculi]